VRPGCESPAQWLLIGILWMNFSSCDQQISARKQPSASLVNLDPQLAGGAISFDGRLGGVVEQTPGSITLKVKRDRVIPVCKALLDELPVTDIEIQEVLIEEVIRRVFAR
jgi:ABC-type uncharacterized transport system ATPase subunit